MNTCETCKANKVCDHDRFGFENCGSYISPDLVNRQKFASEIFFDIDREINRMMSFRLFGLKNDKTTCTSYDLGRANALYGVLDITNELKKKYTAATDTNVGGTDGEG